MTMHSYDTYNVDDPESWARAWRSDPAGGQLCDHWDSLIQVFRSKAPLGRPAPEFSGQLLDGSEFRISEYRGKRSVLVIFGCLACPPCVTNINTTTPSLNELYAKHKEACEFVYVYTREAHPGTNVGAHKSIEEKRERATTLLNLESISFPVLVDSLDGTIHKSYADPSFNNPVFLINRAGLTTYKSAWLDAAELPQVLEDQRLWDERSLVDATMKKTYSERLRPLREQYSQRSYAKLTQLIDIVGIDAAKLGKVPGLGSEKITKA